MVHAVAIVCARELSTVPRDLLDLNATIAANRERGIDLPIPADRNEISLRIRQAAVGYAHCSVLRVQPRATIALMTSADRLKRPTA